MHINICCGCSEIGKSANLKRTSIADIVITPCPGEQQRYVRQTIKSFSNRTVIFRDVVSNRPKTAATTLWTFTWFDTAYRAVCMVIRPAWIRSRCGARGCCVSHNICGIRRYIERILRQIYVVFITIQLHCLDRPPQTGWQAALSHVRACRSK